MFVYDCCSSAEGLSRHKILVFPAETKSEDAEDIVVGNESNL